ncbi:MAG: ATP-binding protein [Caldimonas sp.]
MNTSIRRRLSVWLFAAILGAGLVASAFSFVLTFQDAKELQDTQLQNVAALLAKGSALPESQRFAPRNDEDAETNYVVRRLQPSPAEPSPSMAPILTADLPPGLQSLEASGVGWRAVVATNATGQRFAVAQRIAVRDEVARSSALLTLLPSLVLIPVLLSIVGLVLRRAFVPMKAMSEAVDHLAGDRPEPLDERQIPLEALHLVQAFNRLISRLALALEQQRRFVSDAAHELRTPVATLIVQAENVLHATLPPEARERVGVLRQGLAQMSSLIDQLLSLARLQGAAPMVQERLNLAELVRDAIEETLPMADIKGVDLGCLRLDSAAAIEGDRFHAYALVRNAIDNAVRYTPAGGSVDVSVLLEGGETCFVVEDTGPGIASGELERVFEPFVRVLGSASSGSGLGLAIARSSAQTLGGRIELAGRQDRGSGLRFTYLQPAYDHLHGANPPAGHDSGIVAGSGR